MTINDEEALWMFVYIAAVLNGTGIPKDTADTAVLAFRNTEVLYPPQPPEQWEDEDLPF